MKYLITLALLVALSIPAIAQDQQQWSGVAVGLSGTLKNGELMKDWGANIAYPLVIKRSNVTLLVVPQAAYASTNGLTSGGAGVLAGVKSFSWGGLFLGGSFLPFEFATTDSVQYNNTATVTLDALLYMTWQRTYPFFRLQLDFPTMTSDKLAIEDRPAQTLKLTAGIAF